MGDDENEKLVVVPESERELTPVERQMRDGSVSLDEPTEKPKDEYDPIRDDKFTRDSLVPWAFQDIMRNNLYHAKNGLILADGSDRDEVDINADFLSVEGLGFKDVDLTADIGASGANGLDTGAVGGANDTWYSVWVIATSRGEKLTSLLSLSSTAPTLPAGFVLKRLVGFVRNNGSGDFYRFVHSKNSWLFWWNEDTGAGDFRVLSAVGAGVASFTNVDASAVVPPTSCLAILRLNYNQASVEGIHLRGDDMGNVGKNMGSLATGASVAGVGGAFVRLDGSQVFEYAVTNDLDDAEIYVIGYALQDI